MRRPWTTRGCQVRKVMEGNSRGLVEDMHGESAQMMNIAVGILISSREFVSRN
jgi:hypothetical protein